MFYTNVILIDDEVKFSNKEMNLLNENRFFIKQIKQADLHLIDSTILSFQNIILLNFNLIEEFIYINPKPFDFLAPAVVLLKSSESQECQHHKVNSYAFLNKPLNINDLILTLSIVNHRKNIDNESFRNINIYNKKVQNLSSFNHDLIFVKSNNLIVKILKSEIYYVEALKDYVTIHTKNDKYIIHSSMKKILVKLGDKDFIRVHRSFIVRIDKISRIDFPNIYLDDAKKIIPIGNSYKNDLFDLIDLG